MSQKYPFQNETIIKTELFDIGQDWELPIPGFFVIGVLDESIKSIDQFSDEHLQEYIKLLKIIREGMRKVLGIKEVYFFQNEDAHHFHLWIFPRHEWMEQFGRKIQSVRPIMEYAKENMMNEENIRKIKNDVQKMKEFVKITK